METLQKEEEAYRALLTESEGLTSEIE